MVKKLYIIYDKVTELYYGTSGYWASTPRVYSSMRNLTANLLQALPHKAFRDDFAIKNIIIFEIDPVVSREISYEEYFLEKKKRADEKYLKQKVKNEKNREEIKILEAKLRKLRSL